MSTEQKALAAVIAYEAHPDRQRNAARVHKCGYDLLSRGRDEERHIEVKGTQESKFTFRWLEPKEEERLQNDANFWMYLVTDVGSEKPRIWEYNKAKLSERFDRVVKHCQYKFPKSDFK